MNYQETLKALFSAKSQKGGLETMQAMSSHLGLLSHPFKVIHVAGTNGKGSCVTKIAAGLVHDGYKVGVYTSPHIATYRERIKIGSEMISEQEVVKHFAPLFSIASFHGISPTFFEYSTLLAFRYFAEQLVDYAVIETGIGGRLDATNICTPILCVITSISLDHMAILGHTEDEIAYEKAGIIKPQVPCIIGPSVPYESMSWQSWLNNASLKQVRGPFSDYEEENRAIAKEAMLQLGISCHSIESGLQVTPPCRFQTLFHHDLRQTFGPNVPKCVILDVAHNPAGIEQLFMRIQEPVYVLCGFSADKDVDSCLDVLKQKAERLYFVQAAGARAMPSQELAKRVAGGRAFESIKEGVAYAFLDAAKEAKTLVVCGSFYIMRQVRQFFGIHECSDSDES